jgi:hypothetical protein
VTDTVCAVFECVIVFGVHGLCGILLETLAVKCGTGLSGGIASIQANWVATLGAKLSGGTPNFRENSNTQKTLISQYLSQGLCT